MAVTSPTLAEREEYDRQILRLAASQILHGSESLCKLLRYLAGLALDRAGAPVREYQIATEVFGRPPNFDPRLDSTVRVQTGRLRSKLAEYYGAAGADDPVIVEIPRGSYCLTFHFRPPPPIPALPVPAAVAPEPAAAASHGAGGNGVAGNAAAGNRPGGNRAGGNRVWFGAVGLLAVLLAATAGALVHALSSAQPLASLSRANREEILVFQRFWKFFIDSPDEPWVVFSNAEFVGRPETGMRYFNPAQDPRTAIVDHYTGVGEVLGVHELDRVFTVAGHGLRVKRGRLLSLDDAKNNNLIFVGSPSENLPLREIPTTQEFVFKRTDSASRKGDLAIVVMHPRPGETKAYLASAGNPLTEDYSIVAMIPGMNEMRKAMILAGITTIGTQAAVEYVCRASNVDDLMKRLTGTNTGEIVPFEAVLRVRVTGGVPVRSEIVALRAIK